LVRATEARILAIFSSSCSRNGFARHHAVAQQAQHHFLRHVEPVGADLPSLEVEQYLAAGAEHVRDRLLVLEAGLHQRIPLEVRQCQPRAVRRCGRNGVQRALDLLGTVRGRIRVLGAGEAQ
jgi:hypothetical protein